MNKEEIMECNEKYFMNVFSGRYPLVVDRGEGIKVYDKNGDAYRDFLAGIGVNALGYSNKELKKALKEQVEKITHSSNLYYIEPQAKLEKLLIENSCADKLFFANSGTEAVEGAIKLARKYFYKQGDKRHEIISTVNSFHGRTLTALSATGQEKYQESFEPLPPGFKYASYNDIEALQEKISKNTAAVILEPIQGEGGVYPADKQYLKEVRQLCDDKDVLLIFDEIQCGMGRTGYLFAFEEYGVEPDIFTLAKGLGGGVPVGAFLARGEVADAFEPGDHGSTFGGNHLATAAGYAVVKQLLADGFLESVRETAAYFWNCLQELVAEDDRLLEVRGRGLMLALQMNEQLPAKEIVMDLFEEGFLINAVQDHTLRFLPPLVVGKEDIYLLLEALEEILDKFQGGKDNGKRSE